MSDPIWQQPPPNAGLQRLPAPESQWSPGVGDSEWRQLGRGVLQGSGALLMGEDTVARLSRYGAALRPAPVEGYSPFEDLAPLRGYEEDLGLFVDSRSPDETAYIRQQIDERRRRAQALDQAGWVTQFIAGNITPEALATLPLGVGAIAGVTRGARMVSGAARVGAMSAATAAGESLTRDPQLPAAARGDLLTETALAGVFGAALGSLAGAFLGDDLSRAAARHARQHDRTDGLRTPGVPDPLAVRARRDEVVLRERGEPEIEPVAVAVAREELRRLAGPAAELDVRRLPDGYLGLATGNIVSLASQVAESAPNARYIVRHETIHVLRAMGGLTETEWRTLTRAAETEGWQKAFLRSYADQPPEARLEEAVAEQFASWLQGRTMRTGQVAPEVRTIWEKLSELLQRVANGLRGRGFDTADSVFRRIERGDVARRETLRDYGRTEEARAVHASFIRDGIASDEFDPRARLDDGELSPFETPDEGLPERLSDQRRAPTAFLLDEIEGGRLTETQVAAARAELEARGLDPDTAMIVTGRDVAPQVERAPLAEGRVANDRRRATWRVRDVWADRWVEVRSIANDLDPVAPVARVDGDGAPPPAARDAGASSSPPADMPPDVPGDPPPPGPPPGPPPVDAGPPAIPPAAMDGNRLADAFGAERGRYTPWYVLKNNRFTGPVADRLARWADELAMIPGLRLRGNATGEVATETGSVEARARQHSARYLAAERAQREQYYLYRGWNPDEAGDIRSRAVELKEAVLGVGQPGKLTFAEFDQAVGRAIATGEGPKEAVEAARLWREVFYDPMEAEGAAAGVLLTARHRNAGIGAITREMESAGMRRADAARELMARNRLSEDLYEAREAAQRGVAGIDRLLGRLSEDAEALRARQAEMQAAADAGRIGIDEANTGLRALELEAKALDRRVAGARTKQADHQMRLDEITARLGELAKDGINRAWMDEIEGIYAELRVSKQRLEALKGAEAHPEPYVPHVWIKEKVERGWDELTRRIADRWRAEAGHTWASPEVRAVVAMSHVMDYGVAGTLERVLERHFRAGGMEKAAAATRAREMAAPVRQAMETREPGRVRVEVASAFGRRLPEPDKDGIPALVHRALQDAGVPGQATRSTAIDVAAGTSPDMAPAAAPPGQGLGRLVQEIVNLSRDEQGDRWADFNRPGHARRRTIDVPTKDLADFLDLSQRNGALQYARRIGTAIEMQRKFGDASMLGRLSSERIAMLREVQAGRGTIDEMRAVDQSARDLRDKLLGTFMVPEDPDALSIRTIRFMQHNAIMAQMGMSLFSVVTDLGRTAMAVGFGRVAKGIMEGNPLWGAQAVGYRLAGREAELAGAASETALLGRASALLDIQHVGGDRTWAERAAQAGAETMMFVNLMAPATQLGQRFAGGLIQSEMVELSAKSVDGTLKPADLVRLRAYGIDDGLARRIAAEWRAAGGESRGQLRLANTDQWQDRELVRHFRAALATAVDSAVMRPNVADRPNFMSAPIWQGLLLYKGFTIAASQRMLLAGLQQRDAYVLSGVLSSVALAWIFQGPADGAFDKNPFLSMERLVAAVERSGAVGLLSDANQALEVMSGNGAGLRPLLGIDPPTFRKDPHWAQRLAQITGPATAPPLNLMWALTSPDATGDQAAGAVRRMLPFNNLLWWEGAVRGVTREIGTSLGGRRRLREEGDDE